MYQWSIQKHSLDLKFLWRISKGASQSKTIYTIQVKTGSLTGEGEVAAVTTDAVKQNDLESQFKAFTESAKDGITAIDRYGLPNHLRFGIESAWTHLQAKMSQKSVSEYLGLRPTQELITSFAMPILPVKEIRPFFDKFNLERFEVIKLKVGNDSPVECCLKLAEIYKKPIRIDANEAFTSAEETLQFMKAISHLPVEFIEQPMPADCEAEYHKLKNLSLFPIIADESIQDGEITPAHRAMFHGINVKLMKAGGYKRALNQLQQARSLGLKTMLGCMVETSLGIQSAMNIADQVDYFDLDGFLYFKDEPFGLVQEQSGRIFAL